MKRRRQKIDRTIIRGCTGRLMTRIMAPLIAATRRRRKFRNQTALKLED
jgi:hypothetical protein